MQTTTTYYCLTLTIFFFNICSLTKGLCQSEFRLGYYVTFQGDTIQGLLLHDNARNYQECTFRENEQTPEVRFSPQQIHTYHFDSGKHFESMTLPVSGVDHTVFVEYLIRGKADIYYLRFQGDHYFIRTESGGLMELTQDKEIVFGPNSNYFRPESYIGKLKYMFSETPELFDEIEKTSLNHHSLIDIAKQYHYKVCTPGEECIEFEHDRKNMRLVIMPFGGLTLHKVGFRNQITSDFRPTVLGGIKVEVRNIFSWSGGTSFWIDIAMHQLTNHTLTDFDHEFIQYQGIRYRMAPVGAFVINSLSEIEVNLQALVLRTPFGIVHTTSRGKLRFRYGAGISNSFILSQTDDLRIELNYSFLGKTIPPHYLGVVGLFGMRYHLNETNHILFEMSYDQSSSLNTQQFARGKLHLISAKVGYTF